MTYSREFNAGTVDEALRKASDSLGLAASDLSYEVLDYGSEGFLGIGARDARIVVRVPDSEGIADSQEGAYEPDDEAASEETPLVPAHA